MKGKEKGPAGSPSAGEPAFLEIGKIRRPHGVQGDMLVEMDPRYSEKLEPNREVFIGEIHSPANISRVRHHLDGILMSLEGCNSPEQAGRFRNQILYIRDVKNTILSKGEYFHHELIGLDVWDDVGNHLGKINQIMQTGANDVFVVEDNSENEILLPAIPDVVKKVDLKEMKMVVHLLPGLTGKD